MEQTQLNTQGIYHVSALLEASYRGHEEIVRLLLAEGADVNAQGGTYRCVLQAASTGDHNATTLLLRNVSAQRGEHEHALQAKLSEDHDIVVQSQQWKGSGCHYT